MASPPGPWEALSMFTASVAANVSVSYSVFKGALHREARANSRPMYQSSSSSVPSSAWTPSPPVIRSQSARTNSPMNSCSNLGWLMSMLTFWSFVLHLETPRLSCGHRRLLQQGLSSSEMTLCSVIAGGRPPSSQSSGLRLYNPQTMNGELVASGILASTYGKAVDPVFAHMF